MNQIFLAMKELMDNTDTTVKAALSNEYERIKDCVLNDFSANDCWYFSLGVTGVTLALIKANKQSTLSALKCAPAGERYFIVKVLTEQLIGFCINEYSHDEMATAINKCRYNFNRKPSRFNALALLKSRLPDVINTSVMSDFDFKNGSVLLMAIDTNSLTYLTSAGVRKLVALPFDANRFNGCCKLSMVSEYGHANFSHVKRASFQRALKAKNAA